VDAARDIIARVAAGGPEIPPDPATPEPGPPAIDSPASMARLRATFADSHDGWVDDNIAFAQRWGFKMNDITAPVSIWFGTRDAYGRGHANWLLSNIQAQPVITRSAQWPHLQTGFKRRAVMRSTASLAGHRLACWPGGPELGVRPHVEDGQLTGAGHRAGDQGRTGGHLAATGICEPVRCSVSVTGIGLACEIVQIRP
jgi:hypothetical protein